MSGTPPFSVLRRRDIKPKVNYNWQINGETFAGKRVYAHGLDLDAHTLDFIESGLNQALPDHRTARIQVIQNMVEELKLDGKDLPIKISHNSRKKMPVIIDPQTGETIIEWLLRYLITNRAPFLAARNPDTFSEFMDDDAPVPNNVSSLNADALQPDPTTPEEGSPGREGIL